MENEKIFSSNNLPHTFAALNSRDLQDFGIPACLILGWERLERGGMGRSREGRIRRAVDGSAMSGGKAREGEMRRG